MSGISFFAFQQMGVLEDTTLTIFPSSKLTSFNPLLKCWAIPFEYTSSAIVLNMLLIVGNTEAKVDIVFANAGATGTPLREPSMELVVDFRVLIVEVGTGFEKGG